MNSISKSLLIALAVTMVALGVILYIAHETVIKTIPLSYQFEGVVREDKINAIVSRNGELYQLDLFYPKDCPHFKLPPKGTEVKLLTKYYFKPHSYSVFQTLRLDENCDSLKKLCNCYEE